jgi:pectate lyase
MNMTSGSEVTQPDLSLFPFFAIYEYGDTISINEIIVWSRSGTRMSINPWDVYTSAGNGTLTIDGNISNNWTSGNLFPMSFIRIYLRDLANVRNFQIYNPSNTSLVGTTIRLGTFGDNFQVQITSSCILQNITFPL